MLFAHLKRILRLDRLRLRGPNGARDEFHLAAAAQNLRKMAKIIPMAAPAMARRRAPPLAGTVRFCQMPTLSTASASCCDRLPPDARNCGSPQALPSCSHHGTDLMDRLRRLETFARTGWFARGIVYCLLAYIAITGSGASDPSPQAVFRSLRDMPAGTLLLLLLAIGLALYGAYRLYGAVLDSEGKGSELKGIAIRIGYSASGIAHFVLAWAALRLAAGGGEERNGEEAAAGMLLDLPLGGALLGLIGAAFLAAAAHQAIKAWTTEFARDLSPHAPRWPAPGGRPGRAARAVVFFVIGGSLVRAGWFGAAGEVKGLGDALSSLTDNPTLYLLVAAGLFLFGVHSIVEARWRRIRDEDVIARIVAARR